MKLRLPYALLRALMACLAACVSTSLASASPGTRSDSLLLPDVEQTDSMLCWAASAADILAMETGQDAATIYRCLTETSGNSPGYVETALSWYQSGALGELRPQEFDGSHSVSRRGFDSLETLAAALEEGLGSKTALAAMLRARGEETSLGHAVTVYAAEYEHGHLYLTLADSADSVQGVRRVEVLPSVDGLLLAGTDEVVSSLTWLGDEDEDEAPAAPVGAYMHSSPLLQEYTDMAENRGVYRFGGSASVITYRNGEADYMLSVTPDYASVADNGAYTLTYNNGYVLSVQHNGIFDGAFTSRFVGSEYAQQYSGVGIRNNKTFVFGCGEYGNNDNPYVSFHEDYKVERLSRLVTDGSSVHYNTDPNVLTNLKGVTIYRVGAGNSGWYDTQGNINWNVAAWGAGLTAGITQLAGSYDAGNGLYNIEYSPGSYVICTPDNALPSVGQPGDSGSPVYIYNESEGRFEFVGSLQGASDTFWISRYNPSATTEAIEYCTTTLATTVDADGTDATTYYISGAKVGADDELIQDGEAATYLRKGSISLNGETVATFNGVALEEFSQGTWKKLDADSLTWYTYSDSDYINALPDKATDANTFGTDDLFYTSNLHFKADAANGATSASRRIELTENVDLGVGHVQFSLGEGVTTATYELGQAAPNYFLSSAGFVVDKGVTLNNYFTYEKGRELRRVGEGVMNMVGTGNNDVLLNIGGNGLTYLNRTGGYAAYSALVNSGAVLKLADAGQVYNNVTLGANGGVLDFNGNDYRWTSGGARAQGSDGQTYFGLTVYEGLNRVETSTLANYAAGTTSTITIERTDDFEFAGAFRDGSTYSASGSVEMDSRYTMMPSLLMGQYKQYSAAERQDSSATLKVIYKGGGTLSMTGVYTLLTGDSGLEVANGKVTLHGTNTIHAIGSETGTDVNRWQNSADWHYAMAEINVKVGSGSSFELGDHALLIGNVQVEQGGSFVMKQAVNERYEFVEGWYIAEDTYALADYYGLKGNVALASGATMEIRFDEGVSTQLGYSGSISGSGSLTVNAGEGSVQFSGQNSFTGEKTVTSGNLRLAAGAEGNTTTHKWKVESAGSLALDALSTNAQLESLVDAASTGVLALTQDFAEQVSLGGLIVGAAEGESVHYGSASASLQPTNNQWTLGGGGGTLYVDSRLEGTGKLVLGNAYGKGTVVLANEQNNFSGGIEMAGNITLGYTSAGALGNNVLSLGYGQTLAAVDGADFAADKLASASNGIFALSDGTKTYELSQHSSLSLGAYGSATLTGALTVAENAAYRFGGAGELTVATQLSGNHGIVIDGQGSTGSRVILATASADTGAVVVQGYDAAHASAGEVTLSFSTDNALASASSVTLRNNAGMDLNGTNQQFQSLAGDSSSLIFDDKGGNTLTLDNEETVELTVRVQAAGTEFVKSGSGTLILSGEKLWQGLTVQEGTVQVADTKALGYLDSGSQGIEVSVHEGGTLLFTKDASFTNTLNIAGYGTDGASHAISITGELNNSLGTLNVTANAAISGNFSFKQLNLLGNTLSLQGSGSSLTASAIASGTLRLSEGAVINLAGFKGGADVVLVLDNATANVAGGTFAGTLSVGANGATVYYPWDNTSTDAFNLTGHVSGTSADSMLKLVGYNHTINLSGGADLAGKVEVGNGLTLNVTKDASVGALVNEANAGDLSRVVVDSATLRLTSGGNNFGTNNNPGNIELVNGALLQLQGLDDGSSMGALGTLQLGTDGVLSLAGLAGYTGDKAMMSIATIEGTRSLQIDTATLSSLANGSTYHLLTSANELSGWTLLNNQVSGSRQTLELVSGGTEGAYTLDLKVTGALAAATWQGTGVLVAGQVNATNISSSAGDNTFMAMDSLTITSDAGASDTLTLGGEIAASSVTVTGEGSVTLAQQDGGKFAAGTSVVMDGTGCLVLGDTQAISGEIELRQGTLSGSSTSLNGTEGVRVTGDAAFELTSATHVTAGIDIAEGKSLRVAFKDDSMASQWGGNFDNNLSGKGSLQVDIGSGRELHLNGDHSAFSGEIAVQSGTLQLGMREDNGQLLSLTLGAQKISLDQGTTLSLSSAATTVAADIDWAGGSTLHVKDGADNTIAYTFSGRQTLGGALTISGAENKSVHVSGDIEGSGSLNFTGESSFILSGNNSYSGGTTLNNSKVTVYAASENAFGTGTIKLQNGTLAWYGVGGSWDGDLAASSIEASEGTTINTNGYDVVYGGSVSGTITKSGAGTLTLTQNYTNSGATHVQQGTLALNIGESFWYTGFSGDEGATLRLNSSSTYGTYLMGALSGGMTVELSGDFGYVAANTHTGGTTLLSGSLEIGNVDALKSGSLQAAGGTEVSIVMEKTYMAGESVVDALAFGSGASVLVGADNAAGHLSFGSLSGSASFLLDIFSADSYDRLSGTLTNGSLLAVNLNASELGDYLLVEGDNSGFDTSAFSYSGSTNSGHIYLWSSSERGIMLSIQDAALAADANVWTGGNRGVWDTSTTPWYGGSYSADRKTLFLAQGDMSISVASAVTTTTLEADVDAGATLSFSQDGGSITATSTLQKDGEGTLAFASGMNNSFGSVVVNEGVLSVADGNALGTNMISGNGTFELVGGTLRVDLNGGAMAVKNIRLDGASLEFYSTETPWGTSITGRTVEILGENSCFSLESVNYNASSIILRDGGTLRSGNNGMGNDGGSIYVDGAGTIAYGNTGGGNVAASVSGHGTLKVIDWNPGHWVSFNNTIADDTNAATPLALELSQNYVVMNAANSYSGGTTITAGHVIVSNASALGSGSLHMTGGSLTMETTFRDINYSTDLHIGSLSGTGGEIQMGAKSLLINQTEDGLFAGTLSGTGTLTKAGAGKLTLSGNNSVGGSIVVSEGTLAYDAGTSSTLGAVSGDGTFELIGGAVNASSINVGRLVVANSVLAYNSTFDGKLLEVSGQGAELRMGHWASVNNSSLLLKDGGKLSMSSSGFSGSTVTVDGSGIIAVGETASSDENPLLNVNSTISGTGTLYFTDYGSRAYTTNINTAISDAADGALAVTTNQSDLHFTQANTYSGGTTINGGKLTAETVGALGSGSLTVNGGELILSLGDTAQTFSIGSLSGTGGTVDIGKHTLVINQTLDGCYDGSIISGDGTGNITKRGDATLELGGSAQIRGIQIESGTVRLADSGVFSEAVRLTMVGGVFDINGQTTSPEADCYMFNIDKGYILYQQNAESSLLTDSSGRAGSGIGFDTSSSYAGEAITSWSSSNSEIAADIVSGGNGGAGDKIGVLFYGSGDIHISGDIGADHSVASHHQFGIARNGTGTGKLILSGNNGYTGGTDINAGTIVAASDTALGTGALSVASGATLEIAAGYHLTLEGDISFADGSTLKLGSVDAEQATLSTTGGWTLGGGLTLNISAELEAGMTYAVLGGLSSTEGITLTGQNGYNYTCTTELRDGVYYLTTSDYVGGELTWNGASTSSTWVGGNASPWNQGGTASSTGSGSKDTVIFGESGSKEVTVTESGVRVDSMKVQADGYRFDGGSVQANELLVSNEATTSFGDVYTVTQQDAASDASIGKVEMGSDQGANTGFIHGTGSGLTKLDNVVLDIAKGAELELKNLLISDTSRITDDPATVSVENVTVQVSSANTTVQAPITLSAGTTLVQAGGGAQISIEADTSVYTIFCSALDTVNVTGTSLTLDLSTYADELKAAWDAAIYVAISFGETPDSLAHFDAATLDIRATYDGVTFNAVYVETLAQASAATLYLAAPARAIPEPATATLSLLALSLFAARRRRK